MALFESLCDRGGGQVIGKDNDLDLGEANEGGSAGGRNTALDDAKRVSG